jgi:hypothetical protein
MATVANVHVGDVGTLYKAKIQDVGVPFNPTAATVKKLVFKTPAGVLERNATVTTDGTDWYLEYQLQAAVPGDLTFHQKKGGYSWQGYVEFPDGQRYHTNIETYTVDRNLN